jgi:hypothetical protein
VRANTMTLRERSEPGPKGPMTGIRARSDAASAGTERELRTEHGQGAGEHDDPARAERARPERADDRKPSEERGGKRTNEE